MKSFVTTTLPYANSTPHVGHLLEFVQGDALSRFLRKRGETAFNIGLDEHGAKIERAAKLAQLTPQEYVNSYFIKWKQFCELFHIEYDSFYRTSSREHGDGVQKHWRFLEKQGLISKRNYKGYYCVGCESFKTDNYCGDHLCVLPEVEEENYFFDLKRFRHVISDNIENLVGKSRATELSNIAQSLDSISISRNKEAVSWGIPCPDDPTQTIYVWFDALLNYVFANPKWNISRNIQICGPDNLRFQGYIFQAFLVSLGYKFTTKLLVHGTVLDDKGHKLSKTVGNVIDPIDQYRKYGVDAVRWYILAGLSSTENCCWSEEQLIKTWNTLNNTFGNLISRTLNLVEKYGIDTGDLNVRLDFNGYYQAWDECNFQKAAQKLLLTAESLNAFLEQSKPWETKNYKSVSFVYYSLYLLATEFSYFIPAKSEEILQALDRRKKAILFKKFEKPVDKNSKPATVVL